VTPPATVGLAIESLDSMADACTHLAEVLRCIRDGSAELESPELLAAGAAYLTAAAAAGSVFEQWILETRRAVERGLAAGGN
jgi:hypothetical protein